MHIRPEQVQTIAVTFGDANVDVVTTFVVQIHVVVGIGTGGGNILIHIDGVANQGAFGKDHKITESSALSVSAIADVVRPAQAAEESRIVVESGKCSPRCPWIPSVS